MAEQNVDEARKLTIHQSLVRDKLLAGGERSLVVLSGGISALPMATGRLSLIAAGLVFWLVSLVVLRYLAKKDPRMSDAVSRHFNYQAYYPALPSFVAPNSKSRRHQR
jgi:type IV secretory pathway TrbD component